MKFERRLERKGQHQREEFENLKGLEKSSGGEEGQDESGKWKERESEKESVANCRRRKRKRGHVCHDRRDCRVCLGRPFVF